MAQAILPDIYWRFNPQTKQVDIITEGTVLESTTLAQAPTRLAHHRNEAAKVSGVSFVEARPRKRGAA